ncbi:MAG: DsbA family protein [Anaerolineae bacterium]|nr:DsbA family protein [Anaerolineae bacterium]
MENQPITAPTPPPAPARPSGLTALVVVVAFVLGVFAGRVLFAPASASPEDLAALVRGVVAEEIAKLDSGASETAALVDNDPFFGAEDAPVTIVEFSDFYCGFCGRFATQTLPQLQEVYGDKVRFVYRDMPIIGGQASLDAAIAANCAHEQGQFWEFHNLIFENNAARDRAAFVGFATELGLDVAAYETCLDDPAQRNEVTLDLLDGQGLGITGTPAFYINGRFVSGAQPFETFALLIDTELAKLGVE